jgi:beta-glucosidase
VNGTWACENPALLEDFLRGTLGFAGFVRSDGGALQHTDASANGGCDQEMPITLHFGRRLCASVAAGNVSEARLREMVARQLTTHFALGMMDARTGDAHADARDAARTALAREIGAAGAVLLANAGGLLPLTAARLKTLVVFGDQWTVVGNGSGHVNWPYIVSPVDGLRAALPGVTVTYGGFDAATAPALAAAADAAVVVVAVTAAEGFDRLTPDEIPDLSLNRDFPYDALVYAVARANKNTAVAIRGPGACLTPWIADGTVGSAVFAGFAGQEAGNSLADILTGAVNPSGRLTLTWPNSIYETWLSPPGGGAISPAQYPGYDRGRGFPEADFSEGLFVGYKWYDAELSTPAFSFGHGLSFTSFAYSALSVAVTSPAPAAAVSVSFNVTNAGSVAGAEVAQLYVSFPAGLGEPPQQLRGFQKTRVLQPGESVAVTLALDTPRLSIFDVVSDDWRVPRGEFGARVGASSRDIRLTAPFAL